MRTGDAEGEGEEGGLGLRGDSSLLVDGARARAAFLGGDTERDGEREGTLAAARCLGGDTDGDRDA